MGDMHECGLKCVALEQVGVKKGGQVLLDDVSLELRCGGITAVIGANGAGKTTMLRAILGDQRHTGRVLFSDHNGNEVEKIKIGYVPQKLDFDVSSPVSVTDLFAAVGARRPAFLGPGRARRDHIRTCLEQAGCEALAGRRLGELSGGELQRIMLALALDPIPDLLILDEPVSGVDAGGLEQFYKTVSELRRHYHMAIVLVSHDLELVARYADNVALIGGRLLAYGPPDYVYAGDAFKQVFGGLQPLPKGGAR
ncbi:MAG: metal ABC transporter ATP-binding protein [Clostridiales bacterium]|nr:metal ABC transporter ATP-binding protein [Clostridiales bacterium]